MQEQFSLTAKARQQYGKNAARRLRKLNNSIPAIIYGGKADPQALTLNGFEVSKALKNEAFYSHIITIDIDGKSEKAVIKAIQRHPAKSNVTHMDFQRISASTFIHMKVPLHYTGEDKAPGIKQGGGNAFHLMNEVEVKCLPNDLPEYIEVDVSKLELESSLHLSDIKLPKGVDIPLLGQGPEHDIPIVSIHKAKEQVVETPDTSVDSDDQDAEKTDDAKDKNAES